MTAPEGTGWYSVAEAAQLLGVKERAVRKRIAARVLVAERDGGGPWRVQVSAAQAALSGTGSAPHGATVGTNRHSAVPGPSIEAAYQVADETPQVALVPLHTMVEELRGLAEQLNDMGRRNEALALEVGTLRERVAGQEGHLATKDQAITAQREAIAELRRRAELAEDEAGQARAAQQATIAAQAEALAEMCRRAEAAEAELSRRMDNVESFQRMESEPRGSVPPAEPSSIYIEGGGLRARLGRWWRGEA